MALVDALQARLLNQALPAHQRLLSARQASTTMVPILVLICRRTVQLLTIRVTVQPANRHLPKILQFQAGALVTLLWHLSMECASNQKHVQLDFITRVTTCASHVAPVAQRALSSQEPVPGVSPHLHSAVVVAFAIQPRPW